MRDYGLADKKFAIEQLAAKYPWVDSDRVGIYGHSGGGFMSAAALLVPPYNEFFKVAVASAGNHDNNIYNNSWAERYHGLKEVPISKEETAPKPKAVGKKGGKCGKPGDEEQEGDKKDADKKDEVKGDENAKSKADDKQTKDAK